MHATRTYQIGTILISHRKEAEHRHEVSDEFGEELADPGHERRREGAEDLRRVRLVRGDGADAHPFVVVERRDVIGVGDAVGTEGTQDLGDGIGGESLQRKPAKQTVSEGHGGVEVCARVSCDIDPKDVGARPTRSTMSE